MTKEIAAATQEAMVLQKALTKATAEDGVVSYSKMAMELNKAGTNAAKMTTILATGGDRFKESLATANQALALSNRQAFTLGKTMKEVWRVTVQSFKFTAAQTFLRAISSEASKAIKWVTDLNEAVNNIAVVTNKTGDEITKVTEQAIKGSRELKVAAKDYAEGALIFYQQGLNDEEVIRRNEITIKASKAANQSIEQMSKQLTAIWNTYGMVGEEQERAASVGAALAANTAVDFKDIAEAMQSSAAPAAQMGVEYNQLAAIIATVGDVTQQSASTIGNAYKTIFSRFQQLTTEGTDGEVTLNSVSKKLEDLGIKVLDQAGNLRELGDVIDEVGANWDNWTVTQQTAIAQIVGGTRQYGQFLALMNNFDKYQKNLNVANMENGDTLETQYEQALDSITAKAEQSAEAWKRAFGEIIPEDALKTIYDISADIGNVVGTILRGMGGLPGILTAVGAALSSKIVPTLITGAQNAKIMMANLTPEGRKKNINNEYAVQSATLDKKMAATNNPAELASLQTQKSKLGLYKEMALANEEINNKLKTATGMEKIQLEQQQKRLQTAAEIIEKTFNESQELQKQLQTIEEINSKRGVSSLNDQKADLLNEQSQKQEELDTLNQQRNQLNTGASTTEADYQRLEALDAAAAQLAQEIAEIDGRIGSINNKLRDGTAEQLDKMTISYKKSLDELVKIERSGDNQTTKLQKQRQVMQALLSDIKAYSAEGSKTQHSIEGWEKALKKADREGMTQLLQHIKDTLSETEIIGDELGDISDQIIQMMDEVNHSEGIIDPEQFADFEPPKVDTSQIISGFTQIGMTAGMTITSVKSLWDTISNPDTTGLEKLMGIISQLPMLIIGFQQVQGIISTFATQWSNSQAVVQASNLATRMSIETTTAAKYLDIIATAKAQGADIQKSLSSYLVSQGYTEEAAAAAAATIATQANEVATDKATVAATMFGFATKAAFFEFIAIAAIVAAAIGAIVFAFNELKNSSPEGQMKQSAEAAKQVAEEAQKAKEAADTLRQSFDNYNTVEEKLDNCKKGTKEWKEALLETNMAAIDLINSLDDLSVEELQQLFQKDADGVYRMNQDKANELQGRADDRATQLDFASSMAQVSANQASIFNSFDKMGDKMLSTGNNLMDLGLQAGIATNAIVTLGPAGGAASWALRELAEDSLRDKLIANLNDLSGLTLEQFKDKMTDLGLMTADVNKNLEYYYDEVNKLSDATELAAQKMDMIADIAVDNNLGDEYDSTTKEVLSKQLQQQQKAIEQEIQDEMKKFSQADWYGENFSGADKDALVERFNKATGNNYTAASNFARGTDSNRSFAFLDSEGNEKVYNAKAMAEIIAAAEALEKVSGNAEQVAETLSKLNGEGGGLLRGIVANDNTNNLTADQANQLADSNIFNVVSNAKNIFGTENFVAMAEAMNMTELEYAMMLQGMAKETQQMSNNILDSMDKATAEIWKKIDISNLNVGESDAIAKTLQKVYEEQGEEGANVFADIFNRMGADADEFAQIVGEINWQDASVESVKASIERLGYSANMISEQDLPELIRVMQMTSDEGINSVRNQGAAKYEATEQKVIEQAGNFDSSASGADQVAWLREMNYALEEYNDNLRAINGGESAQLPKLTNDFLMLDEAEQKVVLASYEAAAQFGRISQLQLEYGQTQVELEQKLQELADARSSGQTEEQIQEIEREVDRLQKSLEDKQLEIKVQVDNAYKKGIEQVKAEVENLSDTIHKIGDINNIFDSKEIKKIGNSYKLTFKDIETITDAGFAAMLKDAKVCADGTMEINQDVVKAFLEGKESEVIGNTEAEIAKLEAANTALEARKADLQAQMEAALIAQETEGNGAQLLRDALLKDYQAEAEAAAQRATDTLQADTEASEGIQENAVLTDQTKTDAANEAAENEIKASDQSRDNQLDNLDNVGAANVEMTGQMPGVWGTAFTLVKTAVAAPLNGIIGFLNTIIDSANLIPGVNIQRINPIQVGGGAGTGDGSFKNVTRNTTKGLIKGVAETIAKGVTDKTITEPDADAYKKSLEDMGFQDLMDEANQRISSIDEAIGSNNAAIAELRYHMDADLNKYTPEDPRTKHEDEEDKKGGKDKDKGKEDKELLDLSQYDQDELERYENNLNALERYNKELERTSRAADDAWGSGRIVQLRLYQKQLERVGKQQKALIDETKTYYKFDRQRIENSQFGKLLQFEDGEYGDLTNPEQIREWLLLQEQLANIDLENAKKIFNESAKDDAAEAVYEQAEKARESRLAEIEEMRGWLDQFLETYDLLQERIDEQTENIKKELQAKIDDITYRMEFKIGINEYDLKQLEQAIDHLGIIGTRTTKSLQNIVDSFGEIGDNVDISVKGFNELLELRNSLNTSEGAAEYIKRYGKDAWDNYIKNGGSPQELMAEIEGIIEALDGYEEQLYEKNAQMFDQYRTLIDYWIQEFDKINESLDQQLTRLELYDRVMRTTGKQNTARGRETMMQIAQARLDTAKVQRESATQKKQIMQAEYDASLERLNQYRLDTFGLGKYGEDNRAPTGGEDYEVDMLNKLTEQVEANHEALMEAENEEIGCLNSILDEAEAIFELAKEQAKYKLGEDLGGLFYDPNDMMSIYDKKEELDTWYLDDYDKKYHLDKLSNEVTSDIEDISDPELLKKATEFQEKINALREEGVQLREHDIEILEKEWELEKAKAAWDESQQAKNTMRLTRDASGNYSYVYSADQGSEAEDAQQKIKDLEYEIKKMHENLSRESQQAWLQNRQEFFQYLSEVDWAMYESDARYRAEVDATIQYYQERSERFAQEINEHTTAIGKQFTDTTLSVVTNTNKMDDAEKLYTENYNKYVESLKEATRDYQNTTDQELKKVEGDFTDVEDHIRDKVNDIVDSNKLAEKAIRNLRSTADAELRAMNSAITTWVQTWTSQMSALIAKIREAEEALRQLQNQEAQKMDDMSGYYDEGTDYTSLFGNLYSEYLATAGDKAMSPEEYLNKNPWIVDQVYAAMMNDDRRGDSYKGDDPNFSKEDAYQHLVNGWQGFRPGDWNFGKDGSNITIDIDKVIVNGDKHDIMPTASGGLIKTPQVRSLAEEGPELVLNAEDTKNILRAVKFMRETVQAQMGAAWDKQYTAIQEKVSHASSTRYNHDEEYKAYLDAALAGQEQKVQIEAHFPGVTAASEIEEAFNQLITQAAQYRIRQDR